MSRPNPSRAGTAAAFLFALLLAGCGGGGGGGGTQDAQAAAAERQLIAGTLGSVPSSCAVDMGRELTRTNVESTAAGRIDRVQIRSCGKTVSLYEAVPAKAGAGSPVVIALHQTSDDGKEEVMGFRGNPALAYGRTFYDAGFVVVAPDEFIAGDNFDPVNTWSTAPFYREFPGWSAMGRMLQDHLAVARYVEERRAPGCTGVVGHSLGGHNALFLAAFDPNVDVVVSSGGFERIATDDNALRWADDFFTYMPLLKPYVSKPAPRTVPWDFRDVLELIAPRAMLIVQGSADPVWTHPESVPEVVGQVKAAHPLATIELAYHDGRHVFGSDLQLKALDVVKRTCPLPAPGGAAAS